MLYGEEHPCADAVGEMTASDLTMKPDVLLILGTSLHVHGLKTMIREFAKAVHAKAGGKGRVIFINLTRPSESVWKNVLDYWVSMDCDAWVNSMRKHRPDIFQTQPVLKVQVKKAKDKQMPKAIGYGTVAAKPSDDKENQLYASVSTLQKSIQPRVLLTPKKQKPLGDKAGSVGKAFRFLVPSSPPKKRQIPGHSSQLLRQLAEAATAKGPVEQRNNTKEDSQLPTPPSSGDRGSKRSLTEAYQELCDTPSKKKQRLGVKIWQD